MNYDKLAIKYKSILIEFAILVAYAVVAIQGKKEDDISENEARETYGRAWLTDRTERGFIHFTRAGSSANSTKIYSRLEIQATKLTERGFIEHMRRSQEAVDNAVERLTSTMDKMIK